MITKLVQFTSCPLMNTNNVYRYSGVKISEPESLSTHIVDVQMMGYIILDILNNKFDEGLDAGVFLEKALHHDLEESLTGDITRPLKYNNPNVLREVQLVAQDTAKSLYSKYFIDSDRMYEIWDNAKSGKEGVLLKVVDMLTVATKAFREVELLNNKYFLKVVHEVYSYLDTVNDYLRNNSPYGKEATDYLVSLIVDAKSQAQSIWKDNEHLASKYRILDTTLMKESDKNE